MLDFVVGDSLNTLLSALCFVLFLANINVIYIYIASWCIYKQIYIYIYIYIDYHTPRAKSIRVIIYPIQGDLIHTRMNDSRNGVVLVGRGHRGLS